MVLEASFLESSPAAYKVDNIACVSQKQVITTYENFEKKLYLRKIWRALFSRRFILTNPTSSGDTRSVLTKVGSHFAIYGDTWETTRICVRLDSTHTVCGVAQYGRLTQVKRRNVYRNSPGYTDSESRDMIQET